MLGLKDLLVPKNGNEIFLEKNMNKIKGRIYRVSASGVEDIKFEIDLRNNKARVVINEGYKVTIRGIRNECLFNCVESRIKVLLDELNKTNCVQRTFFRKIKIENLSGGVVASTRKIKIWTSDFEVEVKTPVDFETNFDNIRTTVLALFNVLGKLDFYVSLIV